MKSTFLERLNRDSSASVGHMVFTDFLRLGVMKALTVRLPASTIAKLDELFERQPGAWRSRQELMFEMIESAIADYIESQAESQAVARAFQDVARKALARQSRRIDDEAPIALSDSDIDDFALLSTAAIPGIPASELKRELRRQLKENLAQNLSMEYVQAWLARTGWATPDQIAALFANEATFVTPDHSYAMRAVETPESCEVRVFRDNSAVVPTGPREVSLRGSQYRRWVRRLGVRIHAFDTVRDDILSGRLTLIPPDEEGHVGLVYRLVE